MVSAKHKLTQYRVFDNFGLPLPMGGHHRQNSKLQSINQIFNLSSCSNEPYFELTRQSYI